MSEARRELLALLAKRPLELGPASWEVLEGLFDEPLRAASEVGGEVRACLEGLRARAEEDGLLDLRLAERVAAIAQALLSAVEGAPPAHRLLAQAAVRYFVLDEDAEGDTTSVTGFDDDAEVLRAVLAHLGHDALGRALGVDPGGDPGGG